ncbi:MAG TPA: hypothetical protein VEQ60_24240 [Longimicrobium sp.]|nr:hypothetical protein [Longimicrobium sp.]
MTDEKQGEAGASEDGHAIPPDLREVPVHTVAPDPCAEEGEHRPRPQRPHPASDAPLQTVPDVSGVVAQLSLAAAGNQFNALSRFGIQTADAVRMEDRVRAIARERNRYANIFLRDGALEIDSNGVRDYIEYQRAVEVIRAKAAALGYGAESQAVPITSVPGGYVGRFGGNDIYAAAR